MEYLESLVAIKAPSLDLRQKSKSVSPNQKVLGTLGEYDDSTGDSIQCENFAFH